jgi:diadenosine tetraphosphatase ApaH/serine/threonine PP2A family protein phosphatase
MLLALLSDIHSNIEALDACLRHANSHRAERFAFLGDLVGYGADPGAVVDTIAEHAKRGAIVIKGNHDDAIEHKQQSNLSDDAFDAIDWTRSRLTGEQKSFLASLPMTVRHDKMFFVHSSATAPERWQYIQDVTAARLSIEASGATYVFSGHVHDQVLYFLTQTGKIALFHPTSGSAVPIPSHRRWQAIVGSVGQPRDHNPAAAYALFDTTKEEMTFFRVAYDSVSAARKVRQAGLPETLAQRLERGV